MSYQDMPRETLIKIIEGKDRTLQNTKAKLGEVQRELSRVKREVGLQEDGFKDTPSLNVIRFKDHRPVCSEHGAMNRYDHEIYRCTACGVAVSLEEKTIIDRHLCYRCGKPLDYEPDTPNKWVCHSCMKENFRKDKK